MRKFYDDFIQQKPKEMSKTLEDIAFKYMNPETQQPTKVPAAHFEKELGQELERSISQAVGLKFVSIMYEQLNALRKEDGDLFYKALICMDNGLNPKDLRISEQIALNHTYECFQNKQAKERKEFHFLSEDITNEYKRGISDPNIQAERMEISNFLENQETRELNNLQNSNNNMVNDLSHEDEDLEEEYEY